MIVAHEYNSASGMQHTEGVEAQEVAYHHVKKIIQDVQSLSRYHGLRAALSMLAFQASHQAPQPVCICPRVHLHVCLSVDVCLYLCLSVAVCVSYIMGLSMLASQASNSAVHIVHIVERIYSNAFHTYILHDKWATAGPIKAADCHCLPCVGAKNFQLWSRLTLSACRQTDSSSTCWRTAQT